MLKGYKILTSFCVICATLYGGAYGAASVRGGATSRAGSIRTLGAGTTASVKTTTSRTQPATTAANANTESTESVGGMRMSHATGLGGSKLPGKISGTTTSTSGESQNVAELRQAIEQLRNDYDALGEQYNNLLGDVSNVSDTAQVAHETATNNTNTLTVVRGDLSVAKSDIEDLKATGGFDEERVQEALDATLAQRNYATRGELAATDAVARGAVQVADLSQKLNALNIVDKDYVNAAVATGMNETQVQGIINDSLNTTLGNYYTKGQVNAAIDMAKTGMVDKDYVDAQVTGLAPKAYVDSRIANVQTGVSEGVVQGIIDNSIGARLDNYYTKGDVETVVNTAIGDAKEGMVDKDYVNAQLNGLASTTYVDEKVAEIESGVDAGTLYNILETRGYKTGSEVQGIVGDALNNTMGNYYTKGQVDNAINIAKMGMADTDWVNAQLNGLAPKNWVTGQIGVVDAKVNALPLGLDRDAVKGVVEEYGYKNEADVREIMNASGYVKTSELPDLINQWAPGAEIQYADGKLYFVDKDGNDRVVDIRGLDGQDGDQVELQKNGDAIMWRYVSGDDQSWRNLVNMSDLRGADGKSVELDVQPMTVGGMPIKDALVYKKDGENNWQFLYNLDNIAGADGCGIKVETDDYVSGGALLGKTVRLLRDCPASSLDGALLTSFNVLNGVDGTVSEEQIVDALESNPTFMQLKKNVQDLSDGLNNTNSLVSELSDKVDNNTTGLVATNTLATNAWNKVKDLESSNKTAREYVDDRIGDLGFDLLTRRNYANVAAKLGAIDDTKTVAEYINAQISKINTSIQVERGDDGVTYICKTGNNCTTNPNPYTGDWTRISVDVSGYLTRAEADDSFAPIGIVGAVTTAQDAATQAQTQASQAWGKLDGLGNGVTVKDYVDSTIDGKVGFLGVSLLTGKDYSVADKIGIPGTDTVKKYIDDKIATVNTKIQVAQGYDGQTYICKTGNNCTSLPGPYSTDEWARVTVDMSDYLTENDADKLYAPIGTVTAANEAKTAANAAQTAATQAQSAANAAQSKADDAWNKLNGLDGTVKDYIDDKVGSTSSTINVQTVGGVTYICRTGTCLDTPPSAYWAPIEVAVSDEYLTESEGNALYAPRAEYALKSEIGALGGSFTNVGAKIGLNDPQYGNTTVKDYIDNRVSGLSTTIQIETSNGTTYICKQGSGCPTSDFGNTYYWAPVAVNLGDLGTNPATSKTYTVAEKIGLTGNNSSKTVFGYIGDRIGETGNSATYPYAQRSVVEYAQDTYVPFTRLGSEIGSSQTVAQYITQRIGDTGTVTDTWSGQTRPKTVVEFLAGSYVPLTTIGNLGSASYGGQSYTVEGKIGLNSTTDSSKTVKQYVDGKIGSMGDYSSVAERIGSISANQTIKAYIDNKAPNIQIEPGENGTMWYCTTTHCDKPTGVANGWASFNMSDSLGDFLTASEANDLYAAKYVQTAVEDSLTGLSATHTLASSASTAAATADTKAGNAATAAETAQNTANTANTTANNAWDKVKGLNEVSGLSDKTVTGYVDYRLGDITGTVKNYVDTHTPTITVTEGSDGNSYICTGGSCTGTPPGGTGWTKLNVDLSGINSILAGFGGTDEPQTVKGYIGNMGSYNNQYGNPVAYTVETKIGLNTNDTKNTTVKTYVDNWVGLLGKINDSTSATSVAAKLGTEITNADKTVAGYIQSKIDGISRDIQIEQVGNDTYICKTGNNCSKPVSDHPDQWAKITIDVSGYLTEDAADALYAAKSVQTAVEDSSNGLSATYDLASSASTAAATADAKAGNAATAAATADTKAENAATAAATAQNTANTANTTANNAWDKVKGLNEVSGLSDKTVTGYVDYRLGDITGTVKNYVDDKVGSLGNIADSTPATSVADKLGTTITGANKTVAKYIEDYVAANAASGGVTVGTFKVDGENKTYICSDNCTTTPPCSYPGQCGWQELNIDVSSKAEQSDMTAVQNILAGFGTSTGNWGTVKGYIGEMGSYKNSYLQDVNYTVETKIGLNTDETKNKSVTQYIADKLGFTGDDANKTVAQYIAEHAASGGVQVQTVNGTTYICSENCDGVGTPPCADGTYPSACGWQKLEVNLNGYATEQYVNNAIGTLGGDYTNVGAKIDISSGTVKSYVDAVDNRIGDLGGRMVGSERKPYTVSEKLGLPVDYGDKTVAKYIVDYVAANAASGGVTVKTVGNDTYICSENCESEPPCQVSDTPDTCGWQKLEVNLSEYLKASVAEDTYLPKSNLKLVRVGADIHLKRVVGNDSTDYGIVAGVQDLMCRSYRTETVEPGHDGCPESGSVCYKMICNTNGND